ncbi:MAG: beta-ribofuranosylaminobenzene 5'-phosphate synthase family protein [Candidatus Hermodarchaeota archaeon]
MSQPDFDSVTIRATARLHLGFIDLHGGLGRIFGSLGVSIDKPACVVELQRKKDGLVVTGEEKERVKELAEKLASHFGKDKEFQLTVWESIPKHVGLGSGTQLSLAVATAIAMLYGKSLTVHQLSQIMGRGVVSGVGTATFAEGGFVVDGGKPTSTPEGKGSVVVPPLLIRQPVPEDWNFIIAIPDVPKGLSGVREKHAFQELPKGKASHAQETSRLVLMQLIPALIRNDIGRFGEALTRIQILVGDAFSKAQGGRFASPEVEKCVDTMLKAGAVGAGQSSWGPTCYGLVRGLKAASKVKTSVSKAMGDSGGTTFITLANNQGAQITSR